MARYRNGDSDLNDRQRWLLMVSAALGFLTLISHPLSVQLSSGAVINKGYGFIFSPPAHDYISATIKAATLLAQWAGVALLGRVGWLLIRGGGAQSTLGTQSSSTLGATATIKGGLPQSGQPRTLRAGLWRRAVAYALDYILLMVGFIIVLSILGTFSAIAPETAEGLGSLLGIIVFWLFFAIQECGPRQATTGKRVLSIKVVRLDGNAPSFGKASGRHFAKIISGLILGMGFVMCLFTARKQRLHDIMADCIVVRDGATEKEVLAAAAASAR